MTAKNRGVRLARSAEKPIEKRNESGAEIGEHWAKSGDGRARFVFVEQRVVRRSVAADGLSFLFLERDDLVEPRGEALPVALFSGVSPVHLRQRSDASQFLDQFLRQFHRPIVKSAPF